MSRRLAAIAVAALGALSLSVGIARAACTSPAVLAPNALYIAKAPPAVTDRYYSFTVSRPFWTVFAATPHNPWNGDDYDVSVYQNPTGGPAPNCFSGLLGVSAGVTGTDFVVGDFNHDPYGTYYGWVHCYGGSCDGELPTWRDGDLLTVDGAALAYTSTTALTGDDVIHVRDVLLIAGQKYYLNFERNDGLAWKMLLFRNTTSGVYWAGRNAAQIETDHCATYTAPSTGYYGLVVVNDSRPSIASGSFKVSVTTKPTCGCPPVLADGISQFVAGPAIDSRMVVVDDGSWNVVGVRSTGNWDLETASLAEGFPNALCAGASRGASAGPGPGVDLIVSDGSARDVPDTVHVTPYNFLTSDNADVEWAKSAGASLYGLHFQGNLNANDVVRILDAPVASGSPGFEKMRIALTGNLPGVHALVFRRGPLDPPELSKSSAIASISDTGSVTLAPGDRAAVVLVSEAVSFGYVTLDAGMCVPVEHPVRDVPSPVYSDGRFEFDPPDTTWCVLSAVDASPSTDLDVELFGSETGPGYPDCFGDPSAYSGELAGVTDFVVGDFHAMPRDRVRARIFDYFMTPGIAKTAMAEWRQARERVWVNGPVVLDTLTMMPSDGHAVGVHEVRLYAGLPYTINFVTSPANNERVHLFGNAGGGTYWAPRSAEILSTNSSISFTPTFTGTYALVVTPDGGPGGLVRLSVTSPIAAVAPDAPRTTRIARLGPNPTRGPLQLEIDAARSGRARLELLDVAGRTIATNDLGWLEAGSRSVTWRLGEHVGESVAPGLYFARLWLDHELAQTQRVTVMR